MQNIETNTPFGLGPLLNGKYQDPNLNQPIVSVIIPAYKVARFIKETLDSVFAQTFTEFEVIVINDGSPDTFELEREIESYRNQIVYVKQPNCGAGAARNAGLRIARGSYIAFLDGDDVWLPGFLSKQLDLIKSDGGLDLVYADAINFGDGVSESQTNMDFNPSAGDVTFEKLLCGKCAIVTSTVLARRQPILDIGGFDETLRNSQDFDLWLRLLKDSSARMSYQKDVLLRRRIYAGSLASDVLNSFQGELRVLNKMGDRPDLTALERAALEEVKGVRQATMEVIRGKRLLSTGDFPSSLESFKRAQNHHYSWKVAAVLAGMHVSPKVLRYCVQSRLSQ